MNWIYGNNTAIFLRDLNSEPGVQDIIRNTSVKMRRLAYNETNPIVLPVVFLDMYRIATAASNPFGVVNLPYFDDRIFGFSNTALMNVNSFQTPDFSNILQFTKTGFAYNSLLTLSQKGFKNNSTLQFKPIVFMNETNNHPYSLFNELIHKMMIQPGIVVQPYIYAPNSSNTYATKTVGPWVLSSASISGDASGNITMSATMDGSTCLIGNYNLANSSIDIPPTRESMLTDVRVAMGTQAENYFDFNNVFYQDLFLQDYKNNLYNANDLQNVNNKWTAFNLNISNSWNQGYTNHGNTGQYPGYPQKFTSQDAAGPRYFLLTDRRITGSITFVYDQNLDIENDYLFDNSFNHKLIISVAPNFHFPLNSVQFTLGSRIYSPDKTVQVKYNFQAKMNLTSNLSIINALQESKPTSEFGYVYNLDLNELEHA